MRKRSLKKKSLTLAAAVVSALEVGSVVGNVGLPMTNVAEAATALTEEERIAKGLPKINGIVYYSDGTVQDTTGNRFARVELQSYDEDSIVVKRIPRSGGDPAATDSHIMYAGYNTSGNTCNALGEPIPESYAVSSSYSGEIRQGGTTLVGGGSAACYKVFKSWEGVQIMEANIKHRGGPDVNQIVTNANSYSIGSSSAGSNGANKANVGLDNITDAGKQVIRNTVAGDISAAENRSKTDAQNKANTAQSNANAYTDQKLTEAENRAKQDATNKANQAKADAINDAAQKVSDAENRAKADATNKANAAEAAAKADATNKANAAQTNAINTATQKVADAEARAKQDATNKANAAQSAAAQDATNKANAAETNAKSYTDIVTEAAKTYAKTYTDEVAKGKANVGLDNINEDGKNVIKELAKDAMKGTGIDTDGPTIIINKPLETKDIHVDGKITTTGDVEAGGNIHGKGDLEIDGKTTLHGEAIIEGDTTIKGKTIHEGDVINKGNVINEQDVLTKGNQIVDGDTRLKGNTEIDKDLSVHGSETIDKDLRVKGSEIVDGTLTVKDDATFEKDVHIKGSQEVDGNSTIHGNETVDGTLHVKDNAEFDKDVTVHGSETIDKDLTVKGNTEIDKNLTVHGDERIDGSLNVGGDSHIQGSQTIDGDSHIKGNETVDGTLYVKNNAEFDKDVAVHGSETIDKNLHVKGDSETDGNSIVHGSQSVDGEFAVKGNTTLGDDKNNDIVDVNAKTNLHGDTTIGDSDKDKLTVNATSEFKADSVFNKDIYIKGNAEVDKDLSVTGNGSFGKDLYIAGTTNTGALVSRGDAVIGGNTHIYGDTVLDGKFFAKAAAQFGDNVEIAKNLTVGGDTHIVGNAKVDGDIYGRSFNVGSERYIDKNGINANGHKVRNVADGEVSPNSTDAVNGRQLYDVQQQITGDMSQKMSRQITDLDNRLTNNVNKVGAGAAAMANLHPLEFEHNDKFSVSAAVGNYKDQTSMAAGVYYRPNIKSLISLSGTIGNSENMFGLGYSAKFGKVSEFANMTEDHLRDKVSELNDSNKALKAKEADLEKNLSDVTKAYDQLMTKNSDMEKSYSQLMSKVDGLVSELAALKAESHK